MWLRLFRRLGVIGVVLLVVACSSGAGCSSGCTSCGVSPLPAGFPIASTITNSGAIRITRSGLNFMQTNLGTIAGKVLGSSSTINYTIPKTSFSLDGLATIDICDSPGPGQCIVQVELGNAALTLTAAHPDSLTISGTIPVQAASIPMTGLLDCTLNAGLGAGANCSGSTPTFTGFANVPVTIVLPLVAETIAPRTGYTKIDATNATVNLALASSMITVCSSGLCSLLSDIIDDFKSDLVSYLASPLNTDIQNALESALCTKTNTMVTPSCPTGSHDNGGTCYYDASPSTCLPILLGLDGHVDLAGFLASISPGTMGGLDFVLASGGNAIDSTSFANGTLVNTPDSTNGVTLGLMGGALPNPQSDCVPAFNNVVPVGIPIPDEMQDNTQTPWPTTDPTGPDLGIALAGRYLNFAFGSVYNSGALCLGITTDQFAQLQSGLISVLIPSVKRLTFEQKPGPVAVTTRPQNPPVVTIGGGTDINKDPLLSILLKQFSIDFYIWSMDRYVRAMTFTGDMTIPVNLSTAVDPTTNPNGGLLPQLGSIVVANPVVTNSELLVDEPATIATGLGSLFGAIAGQLTGALKPIDLASALSTYGLGMTIPDGGIRKLTKGTDDFLAIFADLELAQMNALVQADVQAQIVSKQVFPEAMSLATADRTKEPMLHVLFGSSLDNGTNVIEYAYAIDTGSHSGWSTTNDFVIQNDALFMQGKHVLNVWARIHGQPLSQSTAPAQVPFIIDVLPPTVTLANASDNSGGIQVSAWDIVSDTSALKMRYQTTDTLGRQSPWTSWTTLADIPGSILGGASATIEVEDEEGNIGSSSSALIRGLPDPSLNTGSGCSSCTVGTAAGGVGWAWGIPTLCGLVALLMRRQGGAAAARRPFSWPFSSPKTVLFGACVVGIAVAPGCSCGSTANPNNCGSDCMQVCDPPLVQGLIGAYTSLAVAKDGTIWVAGYNDSDGVSTLYGDLVVGKWDPAKMAVDWTDVDGVPPIPSGSCPEAAPGWRGGVEDSGPDVGLWTSMVLDPSSQNPMVSYYDATNSQLKFASYNGSSWNIYVLSQGVAITTDQGRYAKMIQVNGNPVVAYLGMEAGMGGYTRSRVIVARANTAVPASATDWTFEDAVVNQQDPCQPQFCTASQACLTTTGGVTGICTATVNGCNPACSSSQACITVMAAATCVDVLDANTYFPNYPTVYGDYVSLANGPNGLGLAVYDRFHGNLWAVADGTGTWVPTLLDGQTGTGTTAVDTGDDGIAANLVITPNGDWNVVYVNGILETLQLIVWPGGTGTPLAPEIVDNGYNNGVAYPDGQHIVGDDANMAIDSSGNITVAYQDSTAGVLRVATGVPAMSGTHKWVAQSIPQPNMFAGYFPKFVTGTAQIANWFRTSDQTDQTESGNVTLITPSP
jgi:hypothetical protein